MFEPIAPAGSGRQPDKSCQAPEEFSRGRERGGEVVEGVVSAVSDSLHHLARFRTKTTSGISGITVQAHTETQIC